DYVWKEGEAVLFDDSWPHSVVNQSEELRAVLIVDVRRPMPLLADLCNRFITDVIARHTYGRSVVRKAEAFASARGAKRPVTACPESSFAYSSAEKPIERQSLPLTLHVYRTLLTAATPLAGMLLSHRLRRGKEDPHRLAERRGESSVARPPGPL